VGTAADEKYNTKIVNMDLNFYEQFNSPDSVKKLWTVEEVNQTFIEQGSLSGKILIGFPSYNFQEWTSGSLSYIYHFVESDPRIQEFAKCFLDSAANIQRQEELIEEAVKYVIDNIQWINQTPGEGETIEVAEIIKQKKGSCVGKSFLLAYLLSRVGLPVYQVEGYAQNVDISGCQGLKERNQSYKKNSRFPGNLFNLPIDNQTPIEQDVGHIWVGTLAGGKMIYADATTGLVSTRLEEKEIFKNYFKPIAGSLFAQGPGREEQQQDACYHDLCFDRPAVRVDVNITGALPEPLKGVMVNEYMGREINNVFPILGFEDIARKEEQ
jgi:transglutaminase-like putative cysteine protease